MTARQEELPIQHLERLIQFTGDVDTAVETLVMDRNLPKRIAQSLACGLGFLPERYQRNEGTLGSEGQKKLLLAKVLVAGLGGLGGYVTEQLARCGTGMIIGVDADQFDETNLNRQLLADINSIGLNKTEAAQKRVAIVNDAVEFSFLTSKIETLPDRVYEGVDIIFDCLDRIPAKLHLQAVAERLTIPLVHGAIGGWYGQVAVVWPRSQLLGTIYGNKREGIETDLGNPPFTPPFIASFMVAEGIKVLLGKERKDNGLFFVDLLNNQWEYITL
jgi:molybdopterin/thiamine biosynthesis adenylyltransferase